MTFLFIKQLTEGFKGEITHTLLLCVLGVSFRGGGGGGGIKIVELILKTLLYDLSSTGKNKAQVYYWNSSYHNR